MITFHNYSIFKTLSRWQNLEIDFNKLYVLQIIEVVLIKKVMISPAI